MRMYLEEPLDDSGTKELIEIFDSQFMAITSNRDAWDAGNEDANPSHHAETKKDGSVEIMGTDVTEGRYYAYITISEDKKVLNLWNFSSHHVDEILEKRGIECTIDKILR